MTSNKMKKMARTKSKEVAIADESVMKQVYVIRGHKVMLDRDLASLYGVETRVLKQAVRRNIDRFPDDFMFEVSDEELNSMVSQFVIPEKKLLEELVLLHLQSKAWPCYPVYSIANKLFILTSRLCACSPVSGKCSRTIRSCGWRLLR